ncbi:MAG: DUF2294 domain-containing protein [Phycisphaerae bacterium]|nr:DUF2294 domain-containing protein [Phycisphaerae bacterium]
MRSQGEIEAAICEGIRRFEQECTAGGPKDIHSHLIDDLVVIRIEGVLTAAEQHLVGPLRGEKGRDLLKQVRIPLIETARAVLESMVLEDTGVEVVSLHHDISTTTGEGVVVGGRFWPSSRRTSPGSLTHSCRALCPVHDQMMDAMHFAAFVMSKEKKDRIGSTEAVAYPRSISPAS